MKQFKDNMPPEEQVKILADFLMQEFGDEIKDEGAIEMAIRLLKEAKYRDGVIGRKII